MKFTCVDDFLIQTLIELLNSDVVLNQRKWCLPT